MKYLLEIGYTADDMDTVTEEDAEIVENIQKNVGYFIGYDNLFSTWLEKGSDFNVADVRDALSAFSRLINSSHRKVFEGVFDTLQTGLSKLGDSSRMALVSAAQKQPKGCFCSTGMRYPLSTQDLNLHMVMIKDQTTRVRSFIIARGGLEPSDGRTRAWRS